MNLMQNKKLFRHQMKQQRKNMPCDIRAEKNAQITQNILDSQVFRQSESIFCYCSFDDEIDTHKIIKTALSMGKTVCIPKVIAKGKMQAYEIKSMDNLVAGHYGILEPDENCRAIGKIDLCLIPCLAVDKYGHRLGYGGGYYDRFLENITAVKAVLCHDERFFEEIPFEKHDIACDIIFTESQVVYLS